jgi:chemotaxis protein methyltransferase CheR
MNDRIATTLSAAEAASNEALERQLLLEAMVRKHGYDFRGYSQASFKRRLRQHLEATGFANLAELLHAVIWDPAAFESLLQALTVNVSEMFRDPPVYRALRHQVLPQLTTRPFLKIWHAGCAQGEEVYSMAIVLHELGRLSQTRLYATDINAAVLQEARAGIFHIQRMKDFTLAYQQAGGTGSFGNYYTARYDSALMRSTLREKVVFAAHNLVTDKVFGEMDLIVCRNVLIYFDRELQDRVVQLFADSLRPGGFLCLGSKESLLHTRCTDFEPFLDKEKIYRKKDADAMGKPS